jgi:hypothetical protein
MIPNSVSFMNRSTQENSSNEPPSIVELSEQEPFGVGGRRICYVDPRDASRCIKVLRNDEKRTVRIRPGLIPNRFRREYNNNAHEQHELGKLFRRLGDDASECLPSCYGVINTDLGPGLVLDLIRDHDGKISRSLRELVSTGHQPSEFRQAFELFSDFMIRHAVLSRAILDHNLATQHRADGSWHLYLIDGLGDPAWLPFARFSRRLAQAKIIRRLEKFWPKLESLAAKPVTTELIENSTWGQGFLKHRN